MPQIYIPIPEAVQLVDPNSGEPLQGENQIIDADFIVRKVLDNPKWNDSFKLMEAAMAIRKSFEDRDNGVAIMAEEDYRAFKEALENPQMLILLPDGKSIVQRGFGLHPRLSPQLVPLIKPMISATSEDLRNKK
jgi:hypothetical protein